MDKRSASKIISGLGLSIMLGTSAAAQNQLTNGGFEDNPPQANGNNVGHMPAGWTFGTGQQPNVVKVDGPGGYNYGTAGPEMDGSGQSGIRHYLDIANGSNSFYQKFVPACSGEVRFGGKFSSRANRIGRGDITIREGDGFTGAIVGQTQNTTTPSGNSQTTPWTSADYTATLTAGQTYSFIVSMDNNTNFDEGYVEFEQDCGGGDIPTTNFLCYDLMAHERGTYRKQITLKDQFGQSYDTVGHAVKLCNPVGVDNNKFDTDAAQDHLVCYEITTMRGGRKTEQRVRIENDLEDNVLVTGHKDMVCLVSTKEHLDNAKP